MAHATFKVGELTAVIGDNAAQGEHRAGYNGVWSLLHSTSTRSLFVPSVAGLNHEHIFNGDFEDDASVFFEPRTAPMAFRQISESEAELHQPPTPTFHLESWTRFKMVAPHYIDMSYRCVATQHVFHRGFIGLFWASYINAPALSFVQNVRAPTSSKNCGNGMRPKRRVEIKSVPEKWGCGLPARSARQSAGRNGGERRYETGARTMHRRRTHSVRQVAGRHRRVACATHRRFF